MLVTIVTLGFFSSGGMSTTCSPAGPFPTMLAAGKEYHYTNITKFEFLQAIKVIKEATKVDWNTKKFKQE